METGFSIIVPAYNCEDFIDECLGSVLSQLPEGCELVVVDDGSSDGTKRKLENYEDMKNVRLAYCEHKGASAARNAGLEISSGEYVAFLDCDDCLQKDFLAKARTYTQKDADLYIFGIERIFLDGKSEIWSVEDAEYPTVSAFADDYIRSGKKLIYSNCNKLYRKSIIEKGGLRFDESMSFGEDRLFNYAYLSACNSYGNSAIVTSELIMLKYIQRRTDSMSGRFIPGYESIAIRLHKAKVECFFALSDGTTREEREFFERNDLLNEKEKIEKNRQK